MSNILTKPYTTKQKTDFIIENNYNKGLHIVETEKALYALNAWEFLENDEIVSNKEIWERKQEEEEAQRIATLKLTKREVFLALYRIKGITPESIREKLSNTEAIIEFDYANEYYRGNPLIDAIGKELGFSSSELDYFFEHKEFPESKGEKDE